MSNPDTSLRTAATGVITPPQTVRKVLVRLKYKARSGFSILTEEYLTFQTVSPDVNFMEDIKKADTGDF